MQTTDITKHIELLDSVLGIAARQSDKARRLPSALRIAEKLEPVGGKEIPVYPSSYAGASDRDPTQYDLNGIEEGPEMTVRLKKGTRTIRTVARAAYCVIDSYQSQANRMEEAFVDERFNALIPQIQVDVPVPGMQKGKGIARRFIEVSKIAHRVADFRIRLTEERGEITQWLREFSNGNALPLVSNMPGSVLFGFWNSRDKELPIKHARLLMSRIDATDVVPFQRNTVYSGMYSNEEIIEVLNIPKPKSEDRKLSAVGFTNAPGGGLGGVLVKGEIFRTSIYSFTDTARLFCTNKENMIDLEKTNAVRRYMFCLGIIAEAYQREFMDYNLRSGCDLVGIGDVKYDMRGGNESYEGIIDLCKNIDAVRLLASDSMERLGIRSDRRTLTLTVRSMKDEFTSTKEADVF